MEKLRKRVREVDLEQAAARCGGPYHQGQLTLLCLGKPFSVDAAGIPYADCHVNRTHVK